MAAAPALRKRLLAYALGLPEAYLDHPWGEDVAKVRKKVFVFFGIQGYAESGMTVKLVESQSLALAQPGVSPSGYNLGKSGWVTVQLGPDLPFEMMREWVDESYRTVAPKSLTVTMRPRADS